MTRLLRRLRTRLVRDDRGDSDVAALIIVVPLGLALVLLFVVFGRQGVAAEGVTHAAAVAARAASMERTAGDAQTAATTAAAATLAAAGTSCSGGPSVAVSASAWEPGGVVSVTVTCTVEGIGDIGAVSRTISSSARSTIDRFWGYE